MSSVTFPECRLPPEARQRTADNEIPQQTNCLGVITQTAAASGFSALVAWSFSIVNLPAALAFGATESLMRSGIQYAIGDKNQTTFDGFLSSLVKTALVYAASGAAATLITQALGFPITFGAAFTLSAAMFVTSCVITALALGCLCCTCLAFLYGASRSPTTETAST